MDLINVTTSQTVEYWTPSPTFQPTNLANRHPYLYFTTIIFGIIIVGTSLLVLLSTCVRLFEQCTSPYSSSSATEGRMICGHRRSIFAPFNPGNASVNAKSSFADDPPDYEAVAKNPSKTVDVVSNRKASIAMNSETPPPSYGSIVVSIE